jgi:hypothetical protein
MTTRLTCSLILEKRQTRKTNAQQNVCEDSNSAAPSQRFVGFISSLWRRSDQFPRTNRRSSYSYLLGTMETGHSWDQKISFRLSDKMDPRVLREISTCHSIQDCSDRSRTESNYSKRAYVLRHPSDLNLETCPKLDIHRLWEFPPARPDQCRFCSKKLISSLDRSATKHCRDTNTGKRKRKRRHTASTDCFIQFVYPCPTIIPIVRIMLLYSIKCSFKRTEKVKDDQVILDSSGNKGNYTGHSSLCNRDATRGWNHDLLHTPLWIIQWAMATWELAWIWSGAET